MSKTNQVLSVLKQALVTFTGKKQAPEMFSHNLEALVSLLETTTGEHVNFPYQFMNPQLWEHPDKAPVTCIDLFENEQVTMGIFILKPNGKIPLHNHPGMHGLIKVIAGKVKVVNYSINTDKTREIDQRSFQGAQASIPFTPKPHRLLTAELTDVMVADTTSPPCFLEPNYRNIHEIQSIDGPAAFLDILSPPYDYPTTDVDSRKCSYYAKLSQVTTNVFRLQETESPSWFWSDSYPYTGPDLY